MSSIDAARVRTWSADAQFDPLAHTLSYVRSQIPYYSGSLPPSPCLSDFPVVNSETLSKHFHDLYHLDGFPDFVATTGGTTGRDHKCLLRNYDELDAAFVRRFGLSDDASLDPDRFDGFTLNLIDHQHGLTLPPRHGQPVLSLPLEAGRHLALVESILTSGLKVRGRQKFVNQITGSTTKLQALTTYCQHVADSGLDYHVHRVVTLAFYCSETWRETMARFWGAEVVSAYGLSEFPEAVATVCRECGHFHIPDTVHAEVLRLDADTDGGALPGRLVLTSLLPYRKAMPLIRYDTNDLVRRRECRSADSVAIEFLGRQDHVLLNERRDAVLLTPFDVIDAVEASLGPDLVRGSEVGTVMRFGIGSMGPDFSGIGYARLRIECPAADGSCKLIVESRAPAEAQADRLRDNLLSRARIRAGGNGERTLQVSVVHEGWFAENGIETTLV